MSVEALFIMAENCIQAQCTTTENEQIVVFSYNKILPSCGNNGLEQVVSTWKNLSNIMLSWEKRSKIQKDTKYNTIDINFRNI